MRRYTHLVRVQIDEISQKLANISVGSPDVVFFFNDTATTEIYTLSLHDALPIYAAFLSTTSGLLVSVAGALSHDVMRGGVGTFRLCAVVAGTVATLAALPVNRFSLGLLVGWAFAIAASSFCPLIVLGIWWRRLTRTPAAAPIQVGGGACCCAIVA